MNQIITEVRQKKNGKTREKSQYNKWTNIKEKWLLDEKLSVMRGSAGARKIRGTSLLTP